MAAFPEISAGIITQLPFASERQWSVVRVVQPSGPQYGYYYDAAPFAAWELSFSVVTEAELATLQAFFVNHGGGWDEFSFTDPDTGITYSKCCFSDESLRVTYLGPNEYKIAITIEAYR